MAARRMLVAVASLVLSLTALPGTVLCVGTNGHLAIEAVGSECVSLAALDAPVAHDGTLSEAALHGCTDTPLGAPGLKRSTDPSQVMHGAVAPVVALPVLDRGSDTATVAARSAPPVVSWTRLSTVLQL